jgi:hypothetical protein
VTKKTEIPDWETLLAHAALLQAKIPAAILVGGTAAAVHAGHRISFDHDHVVKDLAKNYDSAIRALESIAGWHTHRRVKGKMVLGNVNKIAAGLRNQRRSAPLETTEVVVQDGRRLRLPTIEETLRIKTFLVSTAISDARPAACSSKLSSSGKSAFCRGARDESRLIWTLTWRLLIVGSSDRGWGVGIVWQRRTNKLLGHSSHDSS